MFSKVRCPRCGVKNPKDRMTCAECDTPLDLEQVVGHGRKSPAVEMQRSPEYAYPTETAAKPTQETQSSPESAYASQPSVKPVQTYRGPFGWLKEKLRGKTIDELCAALSAIGLDASMVERGRLEEYIYRDWGESQGLIEIRGSPICWATLLKVKSSHDRVATYTNVYLAPDSSVNVHREGYLELESVRARSVPLFGRVIDLDWKTYFVKTKGFSVFRHVSGDRWISDVERSRIRRMNEDISLKETLIRLKEDVVIRGFPDWGWAISSRGYQASWFGRPARQPPPTQEQWDCYETIARHLLDSVGK